MDETGGAARSRTGAGGRVVYGYLTTDAQDAASAPDAVVVLAGEGPRSLRQLRLGAVTGCVFTGRAVQVASHHLSSGDGVAAGFVQQGTMSVEQRGRRAEVGPGQVVLYSAATPYRVHSPGPHRYLVVRVPSSRLRVHDLDTDPAFAADLTALPSATVLAALMRSLCDLEGPFAAPAAHHLGDAVADCVHAVLAEQHLVSAPPRDLFVRLTAWLEEHLREPDLGTEALARSHFLSSRYVRKVFAQHGTTVSAHVRDRRLEAARAELLDPRHRAQRIASIAARWGFQDPSGFSRAFSRRYDESPRSFRLRHEEDRR